MTDSSHEPITKHAPENGAAPRPCAAQYPSLGDWRNFASDGPCDCAHGPQQSQGAPRGAGGNAPALMRARFVLRSTRNGSMRKLKNFRWKKPSSHAHKRLWPPLHRCRRPDGSFGRLRCCRKRALFDAKPDA